MMEGQDRDSKHSRSKRRSVVGGRPHTLRKIVDLCRTEDLGKEEAYSTSSEEREEDHMREGRRKEEKRRKEGKTSSSNTTSGSATTARQSKQLTQAGSGGQGSRYHHREVPPRFQHQKQTKQQKYSKTNQAVNKKPMKDSSRWQQQPQQPQPLQHHFHHPHHHHHHHNPPPSHHPQQNEERWPEDDGGWSVGVPERGSGWGSSETTEASLPEPLSSTYKDATHGPMSTVLDKDWTSSETASGNTSAVTPPLGGGSSEGTSNKSSSVGMEEGGGGGGGGGGEGLWLTLDSRASDSDDWRSASPGYGNKHSQADNCTDDNEGNQSVGEGGKSTGTAVGPSGTGTSMSGESGPVEPNPPAWGMGSKWDMVDGDTSGEDLDRALATELGTSAGSFSLEGGGSRGEVGSGSRSTQEGASDEWDELDTSSLSSNDKDPLAQTFTLNGGTGAVNTGGGKMAPKETTTNDGNKSTANLDLPERNHNNPASDGDSVARNEYFYSSRGKPQTLNIGDSLNPDSSRAGNTFDSVAGMGGREAQPLYSEAGGGGGVWRTGRASIGSTSSVNSVGSSSSWKSDGGKGPRSYQHRGNSPSKPSRFDSSSSQSGSLSGSLKARKLKKPAMDLEDGLESLHSEPSGWGDLPSPKINDNDNGTELWGVPPDVRDRSVRKASVGGNWNDPNHGSPVEWGDDDPSGAIAAGWGGKENTSTRTPTSVGRQWGGGGGGGGGTANDGWNTVTSKHVDKTPTFADNHKKLMDMGFPRHAAEKYLKSNNNDIDAAIGDLLAVSALGDDGNGELTNGTGYQLQNSKNKRHGKSLGPAGAISFQNALASTSASSVSGIPSTSNSALSNAPTGLAPAFNPKDPLYQQLAALQLFGGIPTIQPPLPGQQPNQAQALMQMQLLQQLQQRYLFNQLQLGPMFSPMSNLQTYQQLLTQQLGQLRLMKQQLTQQAKSPALSSQQQQLLTLRLGQVNQSINQINQQLVVISQISSQQKDAAKNQDGGKPTQGGIGSPQIGRNTPPIRNKGDPTLSRSMSANTLGEAGKNLPYSMQGLSLTGASPPPLPSNSAVSQSSARSMSRLQSIFSGSASSDNVTAMAGKESSGIVTPSSGPFPSLPASSSNPLSSSGAIGQGTVHTPTAGTGLSLSSAANTVTVSSSHFPTPKLFDEIQEFKPGVPWQPRAQPTEPAQIYAKPTSLVSPSTMGTSNSGISFPSGRSNPPFSFSQANQGSFTKAGTPGTGPKFTRQKSGGGGSGMFYGAYPPPVGMQSFGPQSSNGNKYGAQSQNRDNRQSWNPPVPDSRGMPFGQTQNRTHYAYRAGQRTNIRNSSGPFGGPTGVPNPNQLPLSFSQPSSNSTALRKPQPSVPFPPPTNLPQYKGNSGFPPGIRAPGNKSHLGHHSFSTPDHMDSINKWGPVVEPPAKLSVWGLDNSKQHKWGSDNHEWGMPPASSELHSHPFDPSSANHTPTSQPYRLAMSSTLSGCWGQEGLNSLRSEANMLSPEPTFDEWQAGKKAHLSVFKLPSNPPSSWLILGNVSSQVDEASLRDVCSEFGAIQTCIINPVMESALIHYSTCDEAVQAKGGLDKNPTICGVNITSDFATNADIGAFFEQLTTPSEDASVSATGRLNMPSALAETTPSWFTESLGEERTLSPPSSTAHTSAADEGPNSAPPKWDDPPYPFNCDTTAPVASMSGATTATTGNRSLWSDGSFLPGLPTPWRNNFTQGNHESEDPNTISGSPSLSTFLPNGLL